MLGLFRVAMMEAQGGLLSLIYNDECMGLQAPSTVELKVQQCGLVVQVPEYLAEGEVIKVDTRTGAFLSRA